MELSMSRYVLSCFIISCFSISGGEAVNGNELHHHKLKGQDLRHRRDIDPEYFANRPDSPNKIAKRSTSKTVDIAMFTDSSAPGTKTFSVYVDSTMTRLIVEVKVERSNPVIIVTKPSGLPGPHPKLNGTASTGTVTATIDVAITAADYGIWKLLKLDGNTWNVKVQGESPLDFSYQFLEGTMFKMPVTGDPIQGNDYTTVITVPEYATIQKVDMILEFITDKSTPANMFPPSDQGGGKYQVASIKMLDKDFMIGIQGRDKSGHFLRRITLIKPIALILSVPSFAGVKLYENTKLDIPFSVVNKLSTDQDIDVSIKDTQGFAEQPHFISATLKPGQNYTGKFVVTGGLLGVTTTVTITAKPYLGRGQVSHGPSEVRQLTVESNQTTTTSTSTTTTSTVTSTSTTSVTSKPTTPSSTASSSTESSSVSTTKSTAKATTSSTSFSPSASSQVTSNTLPVISSSLATSAAPVAVSLSNSVSPIGLKTTTTGKLSTIGSTISSAIHSTQGTAAVSSNQPIGSSRSGATSVVATSLQASTASVSALAGGKVSTAHASVKSVSAASGISSNAPTTSVAATSLKASTASVSALIRGKVSTTHASASARSVSAASGTSSIAATTIKSTSATNSKVSTGPLHVQSTSPPVAQHAAVSALSSSSKTAGQTTTTSPDGGNDETFSKGEIFGAAIVSGVSVGVLIGVAALVTMGLVFKHSINKGKVTPDKKKQRMLSEHNQLAWT